VDKLHPWIEKQNKRVEAVLLEAAVRGDPERQELDNDYYLVKSTYQETGYKLGILVGARLAGCAKGKLRKMAEYLVDTLR
jgi:hypothetical protein